MAKVPHVLYKIFKKEAQDEIGKQDQNINSYKIRLGTCNRFFYIKKNENMKHSKTRLETRAEHKSKKSCIKKKSREPFAMRLICISIAKKKDHFLSSLFFLAEDDEREFVCANL